MPWPWEREQAQDRPQVAAQLDRAIALLGERIADLTKEVDRLKMLRELKERGGTPCQTT